MAKLVRVGANIYRDNGTHIGWLQFDKGWDEERFQPTEEYEAGYDKWDLIQISKLLRN